VDINNLTSEIDVINVGPVLQINVESTGMHFKTLHIICIIYFWICYIANKELLYMKLKEVS